MERNIKVVEWEGRYWIVQVESEEESFMLLDLNGATHAYRDSSNAISIALLIRHRKLEAEKGGRFNC